MSRDEERYQTGKKVAQVGAVVNFLLAVFKLFLGFVGRSQALMADGVHSLSDLICDLLILVAAKYGSADADDNHPYGHRRIETIVTTFLGVILVLIGIGIAIDATMDIAHHHLEKPDWFTAVVAFVSIIANEGLYYYTLRGAKKVDSDMLRANAMHARADSLSSLIVLIGIIGSLLGWTFLDAIAAIIVSLFIIKMGVSWSWKALAELSDEGLSEEDLTNIRRTIMEQTGVLQMHELRTRKMGGKAFLDVHILIKPYTSASEGHRIAEGVRVALMTQFDHLEDLLIHIDVENHPHDLPEFLPPDRNELMEELLPKWQSILDKSDIRRIQLHYLHQQVEIELCLSLQVLKHHDDISLRKAFEDSISKNSHIRKITLSFQ